MTRELLQTLSIPLFGAGVPDDAEIVGGGYDYMTNCMYLYIHSAEYPEAGEGEVICYFEEDPQIRKEMYDRRVKLRRMKEFPEDIFVRVDTPEGPKNKTLAECTFLEALPIIERWFK